MRIAFDGTTLTPGRTGVGYYTEHLLQHLAREVEATGDELVVVSNQPIDTQAPLPPHVRVHDGHRFPIRIGWMQLRAGRALDALRARRRALHQRHDAVPAPPVSTVVTIHDMSLRLYPQCHPLRRLVLNRPLMHVAMRARDGDRHGVAQHAPRPAAAARRARRIACRSCTKPPAPRSARFAIAPRSSSIRARYGLPDRFVLYVGTIEPRKNLARLMDAFARRARPASRTSWSASARTAGRRATWPGASSGSGSRAYVHFTGYVPFEDLPVIYNLGELFVFPSLYEGFGLPVVEAMACGTPVMTANTSSLVEIAGDGAETVDPLNIEALGAGDLRTADRRTAPPRSRAARLARDRARSRGRRRPGHAGGVSARRRRDRRRARGRHDRRGVFMIALDRARDARLRSARAGLRRAGRRRGVSASAPADARRVWPVAPSRLPRARDRMRHRRRHRVSRARRPAGRGVRSVGGDAQPHQAQAVGCRRRAAASPFSRADCSSCRRFSTRSITRRASTPSSRTSARSTASSAWRRSACVGGAAPPARRRGAARPDGPHLRVGDGATSGPRGRAAHSGPPPPASGVMVPVAGVDVPTFYHRTADVGAALGREFTLDATRRHRRRRAAALPRDPMAASAAGAADGWPRASIAWCRRGRASTARRSRAHALGEA